MADVDMNAPLPGVKRSGDERESSLWWCHVWKEDGPWERATLTHLVQVLKALSREQLHDVCVGLCGEGAPNEWIIRFAHGALAMVPTQLLEDERARADRAEQENKRLRLWCGRLSGALAGVQDSARGRFPTPHLDALLVAFASSIDGGAAAEEAERKLAELETK